jgi:hypothetical protein
MKKAVDFLFKESGEREGAVIPLNSLRGYTDPDKISGQLEAHLMVEVKSGEAHGSGRVAIDLGETIVMTCAFDDGTVFLTLVERSKRSGGTGKKSVPT